jgi:hypothetical protein
MIKSNKYYIETHISICLLALILNLLNSCCNTRKDTGKTTDIHTINDCVKMEHDATIYLPLKLTYLKGNLFIADFHGDKMIANLPLSDLNQPQTFAQRGAGPIEFGGPLLIWEYKNKLFVADRQRFQLSYFDIDSPDSITTFKHHQVFSYSSSISKLVSISDTTYVAAGYLPSNRYAVMDKDGQIINYFGSYPDFFQGESAIPYDAKAMFHQVKFTLNPDRQLLASASSHILDIIDINSLQVKRRIKLASYGYVYQSGTIVSAKLNAGYAKGVKSISSCSDYIYLVTNPLNSHNDSTGNNEILLFDWDGTLLKNIKVPCNLDFIKSISCDSIIGLTNAAELFFFEVLMKHGRNF